MASMLDKVKCVFNDKGELVNGWELIKSKLG